MNEMDKGLLGSSCPGATILGTEFRPHFVVPRTGLGGTVEEEMSPELGYLLCMSLLFMSR